jgi:hypothetical protein
LVYSLVGRHALKLSIIFVVTFEAFTAVLIHVDLWVVMVCSVTTVHGVLQPKFLLLTGLNPCEFYLKHMLSVGVSFKILQRKDHLGDLPVATLHNVTT